MMFNIFCCNVVEIGKVLLRVISDGVEELEGGYGYSSWRQKLSGELVFCFPVPFVNASCLWIFCDYLTEFCVSFCVLSSVWWILALEGGVLWLCVCQRYNVWSK